MDTKIADLFPLKKLGCEAPQRNMAILQSELSIEDFLRAFVPNGVPFTAEELMAFPHGHSVDIDTSNMMPIKVTSGVYLGKCTRMNIHPGITDAHRLKLSVAYHDRVVGVIFCASYWAKA